MCLCHTAAFFTMSLPSIPTSSQGFTSNLFLCDSLSLKGPQRQTERWCMFRSDVSVLGLLLPVCGVCECVHMCFTGTGVISIIQPLLNLISSLLQRWNVCCCPWRGFCLCPFFSKSWWYSGSDHDDLWISDHFDEDSISQRPVTVINKVHWARVTSKILYHSISRP